MKHFVWILCGVFVSGLLLGSLSACGAGQTGGVSVTECPSSQEAAESGQSTAAQPALSGDEKSGGEALPDGAPPAGTAAQPDEDAARRLAYAKVLEDALFNGVLPDGTKLDWISPEDAALNEFALCDVDGDGEEELLLRWVNAGMAGMTDFVFHFDGGTVSLEFQEFAGVEFYANGTAKAGWSHNQGWAGRFWPFNLYQYDGSTGAYREVGAVDAWDRSLFEDDETLSAAFPADADLDGDGLVYYLLSGEWFQNDRVPSDGNLNGQLWGVDPVDGPDMENWLNIYIDGTEMVQLPLQNLTAENISELGYWSIPGPSQEAAG